MVFGADADPLLVVIRSNKTGPGDSLHFDARLSSFLCPGRNSEVAYSRDIIASSGNP